MAEDIEHRGIIITIPGNDDGEWRWSLSTGSQKHAKYVLPSPIPRPTYRSRDEAIAGAIEVIDQFLRKKQARRGAL